MKRIENSVNVLLNNVLENISSKHEIELSCLQETVSPLFEKPNFERCEGLVASKNNLPLCRSKVVSGTKFCRRHAPLPDDEGYSTTNVVKQCTALVNNGSRCLKHAKQNHEICGIHLTKLIYIARNAINDNEKIHCIYYEETDEETIEFCNGYIVNKNVWFCKKHNHLQSMYQRMYASKNLVDYTSNNTKRIRIVDKFIEEHEYTPVS
jgi:hypothetical protein